MLIALACAGCTKTGETDGAVSEKTTPATSPKTSTKRDRPARRPAAPEAAPATAVPAESPRPQRVIRPSQKVPQYDERRLAEIGIRRYESKHLILYTDIDPAAARPLPELMDRAYDAWEEYFGPLPADSEGKDFQMIGHVMADRDLFRTAGVLTDEVPNFQHGINRNQLFWMNDQPTLYYREHLLLHEGTHCFMLAYPNPTNQFAWYMEGMAELFGTHFTDEAGTTRLRVLPHDLQVFDGWGRIRIIEEEVHEKGPRRVAAVIGIRPDEFQKNDAYAWSWALCAFLDGHPKYHDRFRRVGFLVTNHNDAVTEMNLVFKDDWNELAEEWLLFAANLCHGYIIDRTVLDFRLAKALSGPGARTQIDIAADRGWQSSGVFVEHGKNYQISASGTCVLSHDPKPWESEPQGISFRYHARLPLGILVAAIRSDAPIEKPPYTTMLDVLPVGRGRQITPDVSGTLYFRVNDDWGELLDNSGMVHVTIEAPPAKNDE